MKGKFEEFHDQADVVEIGSIFYNTKTKEVTGYIEESIENEVTSATPAMSIDPLCEKYPWISPYAYCLNNPVRFIDLDGRDPGDFFKTKDAAAKDWGNYYNGASIQRGNEFASTIYKIKVDGQTGYTYSVANEGGVDHVKRSEAPNGKPAEAIIHSHGEYVNGYVNNDFSNNDKWNSYNMGVDSYVATPDGSLKNMIRIQQRQMS